MFYKKFQNNVYAKIYLLKQAKLINWLGESQKFKTTIEIIEKPSAACFLVAANAVEVAPHGVKEFHMRFISFVEGNSKAKVTFTNISSGIKQLIKNFIYQFSSELIFTLS